MSTETIIDVMSLPVNHEAMGAVAALGRSGMGGIAFEIALHKIIRRFGAQEVVAKRFSNGLAKIAILDPQGRLVAEYTRPEHQQSPVLA